jgi:protein ImuB
MRDAKVFLKLLQMDLKRSPPEAPVQKIWLRAEPVCPRVLQGRLFLPAVPPPEKLELTLARIAGVLNSPPRRRDAETSDSRFLNSDLSHERENTSANQKSDLSNRQFLGSPELLDTHRPGAFRMRHFVPLDAAHATNAVHERQRPAILPVTALRRLRPPVPLAVEVRDGRPLRLSCDGHADLTGQVVWSAGPWRSSGAWWDGAISNSQFANSDCSKGAEQEEEVVAAQTEAEAGWSREDWDIAVRNREGIVVCRACCEQGLWSVEGIYD